MLRFRMEVLASIDLYYDYRTAYDFAYRELWQFFAATTAIIVTSGVIGALFALICAVYKLDSGPYFSRCWLDLPCLRAVRSAPLAPLAPLALADELSVCECPLEQFQDPHRLRRSHAAGRARLPRVSGAGGCSKPRQTRSFCVCS